MIGKLSGRIEYKTLDHVLLDVRGVGYIVHCSDRTLAALPGPGEAAALYTELLVREDLLQLFGFATLIEKEWHRLLLSVQGVGAKGALAILGTLGQDVLARSIAMGDWTPIKAAKGIGPKTAQRIVNELKDKAPTVMAMDAGPVIAPEAPAPGIEPDEAAAEGTSAPAKAAPARKTPKPTPQPRANANAQAEALSALTNLGYQPAEAAGAVATALAEDGDLATPALIRTALRLLAPKD